jgi:hypothetical protein
MAQSVAQRWPVLRIAFPIWANLNRLTAGRTLPVYPEQRTSSDRPGWSGSCQEETHAPQQIAFLFDHLIGTGEQRRWHREAERLRSLEIDDELKSSGKLYR